LIACTIAWIAALGLSFDRLIMLDILLYGVSLILEFVALVVLRIREPRLPRPFVVPGGLIGTIFVGIGPAALLIVAAVKCRGEQVGPISALALGLAIVAAGVLVYFLGQWRRRMASEA
jgi:amino acid transporter